MEAESVVRILVSVLVVSANAFFVAAEYALVGAKRSRIEALAKRDSKSAKAVLQLLDHMTHYVAGVQVCITMCGIGIGAITEPLVSGWLIGLFGAWIGRGLSIAIAFIVVTFVFVVLGELVPKYVTLQNAERMCLWLVHPLRWIVFAIHPLVWLVERSGAVALLPFGIRISQLEEDTVSRSELLLLVASGKSEGVLEELHARVVSKALKLDTLDAADVMIHRLDIRWLDIETPKEELLAKLGRIGHSRAPVCQGDIDEPLGFLYLIDVIRHIEDPDFALHAHLREIEAVPENLPLNRIIERMRATKSQMLLVLDEYGGTSGLITLEDVVEEVFGELEDQIEHERPPIERMARGRLSIRADVRYDEVVDFLHLAHEEEVTTNTLATVIVNGLGRVPRLGDSVETDLGMLRVENMARRRITRVSLYLSPHVAAQVEPEPSAS